MTTETETINNIRKAKLNDTKTVVVKVITTRVKPTKETKTTTISKTLKTTKPETPTKTTIHELHQKAVKTAKHYLHLEKQLLKLIIQIDKTKVFYKLGYNSLFAYINQALKLSPATTYSFIKVARKSQEIPELKTEVLKGKLSISKAQKMTQVLTKENHKKWFEFAENSTHRKLEREVAMACPKALVPERASYVPPTQTVPERVQLKREVPRVSLQLGLSEELMMKIRQVQDLESQRQRKSVSLEETLEALVEIYLDRRDPVRKAKRQKLKGKLQNPKRIGRVNRISLKQMVSYVKNQPEENRIGRDPSRKYHGEKDQPETGFSKKSGNPVKSTQGMKNQGGWEENHLTKDHQGKARQQKKSSDYKLLILSDSVTNSSCEEFLSMHQNPGEDTPLETFGLLERSGQSLSNQKQDQVTRESQNVSGDSLFDRKKDFKRKALPARVTHEVYLRDGGQCTYHDKNGRRCSSKRFLEIHHRKPVSRGGDNSTGNLRLLCSGHHKVCHLSE